MKKTYRKKDFIGADIVSVNRGHACEHCEQKIRTRDTTVSVRIFSHKAVYIHYKCKEAFINALKE
jgi:hypothetical protein